jgi:hypothetical protein
MRTLTSCPRCSLQVAGWLCDDGMIVSCVCCGFVLLDRTGRDYQGLDYHYRIIDGWKRKDIPVSFGSVFSVETVDSRK